MLRLAKCATLAVMMAVSVSAAVAEPSIKFNAKAAGLKVTPGTIEVAGTFEPDAAAYNLKGITFYVRRLEGGKKAGKKVVLKDGVDYDVKTKTWKAKAVNLAPGQYRIFAEIAAEEKATMAVDVWNTADRAAVTVP